LTPPIQQQKQQQWVLSWSIKFHSTKEVGWVEKKKQAAAAQRDLEQLCQFQQRGATSSLSHKKLNPGFNTEFTSHFFQIDFPNAF
jgi:wobble nucleotide-excising tRNase